MKRILHIITGLNSGGAEHMLFKLLKHIEKSEYHHEVLSLMNEGVYGKKLEELGIKVHTANLERKRYIESYYFIKKLTRNFDLIDSWLYHSDFLALFFGKMKFKKKVIWNIRHSNLDASANKITTLGLVKINSYFSQKIDIITYNSKKAYENHINFGYKNKKYKIIPNGFEIDYFKYSDKLRRKTRENLNIKENEKVLITIGRWNIQKDYYTLIDSLEIVKNNGYNFKFIFIGSQLDNENLELIKLINKKGITENVILLGYKEEIPKYLSAADLYISSSLGESFSNSIAEAMCCELNCIVTNVGDSADIVGEHGIVVEPCNPQQLARALMDSIPKPNSRNQNARIRILDKYNIIKTVGLYDNIYKNCFKEIK